MDKIYDAFASFSLSLKASDGVILFSKKKEIQTGLEQHDGE